MTAAVRRRFPWLLLVATLLRLVFVFAAVQATHVPAVVADVLYHPGEGDCDDCDDRSDCHCPPGCPKCPYPPSHTSSGPPPPPPWVGAGPPAVPPVPEAQPRPHYAKGPPPEVVPSSVWRPPRAAR
ncbi:MAG TPA: hypothetical protein VFS00_16960 [Polyangiaceae bacterium]|nr:hypothetical protein [Polyangiaceae bacterium]